MATLKEVEWPESREDLIDDLKALSDLDYQKKVWCAEGHPYSVMSELDFIWNEAPLGNARDTHKYIGLVLRTPEEAEILKPVNEILSKISSQIGGEERNEEYFSSPLWVELLKTAKAAYEVLKRNEEIACSSRNA